MVDCVGTVLHGLVSHAASQVVMYLLQVRRMLHADRPKRVRNVRKAQNQPGELDEVEQAHAEAAVDAALAQHQNLKDIDLGLHEASQEELNEWVNGWLHELELEELASGKPYDLASGSIVYRRSIVLYLW